MAPLILKRASVSRPSGEWSDDNYGVLENGVVVGRTCLDAVGPQGGPLMGVSGQNGETRRAAHGYAASREAAMAAFVKSWRGTKQNRPSRVDIELTSPSDRDWTPKSHRPD